MYNDSTQSVGSLIDWVTEVEKRLAAEQPQRQELPKLKDQATEHKVRPEVGFKMSLSRRVSIATWVGRCQHGLIKWTRDWSAFSCP